MPKLKTKKSALKRVMNITKNGKVTATQAGKQHNMRKRSLRQLRNQRGTVILPEMEAKRMIHFLPYGLK